MIMQAPLDGLKVLDLSRVLAGPWASQLLSDLGASVIKVERPVVGDDTRHWGPPDLRDKNGQSTGEAAYYLSANRGKRSIAIDIRQPEGQALVKQLAQDADILIENFKVGDLARYGLDYTALSEINPRLIYCSITGYGQTGPYADRPGYDFVIQGMSGLMSVTGDADGPPTKVGVAIADLSTGMYATTAILAAVEQRHRTGRGQFIDMALFDTMVAMMANQTMNYLTTEKSPGRLGNSHPNIVPYQAFDTSDGHMVIACGNDGQFRAFCAVASCPEIADDPDFGTNRQRVENRDRLITKMTEICKGRTTSDWVESLSAAGVPVGPVYNMGEAFDDPQIKSREILQHVPHPLSGTVPTVTTPIKYSDAELRAPIAPPLLGEHSRELLTELGISDSEVAQLIEKGVVGAA